MAEIKTKMPWYPNTSIDFDSNGMWIRVSLNIEPGLARFLSPNNVSRGKKLTVYALRSFISSDLVCKSNLETIHNMLLSNCMKNIRNAKIKRNETIEKK